MLVKGWGKGWVGRVRALARVPGPACQRPAFPARDDVTRWRPSADPDRIEQLVRRLLAEPCLQATARLPLQYLPPKRVVGDDHQIPKRLIVSCC